jgi:hypothetical protein
MNDVLVNPLQAPTKGKGDVWLEVLNELPESDFKEVCRARREMGIAKYNQPLQYKDGRDSIIDLFQELLDGIVYSKKAVIEGKLEDIYYAQTLELAKNIFFKHIKGKK